MNQTTCLCFVLLGLATLCFSSPVVKRQALDDHPSIDLAQQDLSDLDDDANRDKRKVEGAVELKYGAKNAILGLFFNKINSFIDQKTRWVSQLDQSNIAKNHAYGIEAPKDPITSFGSVFSSPIAQVGLSYGAGTGAALPRAANLVSPGGKVGPAVTEDAVLFEPGSKVSLDLPGPLFGSGFGLITDISKAAGGLIQNSAERTAKLFEAMKPFFKFVFGPNTLKVHREIPIDNAI